MLKIEPGKAALLVVDIQDRLAQAMPPEDREACERNVVVLIETARRMGMPVVASEQYPKGLGPTVVRIAEALAQPGLSVRRFEKLEFACPGAPAFPAIWEELRREQWIVTGMEAHVCVYQSVRDLADKGAVVHVPVDAVASRTRQNRDIGLALMAKAGGIVTSTEVVVFDALGRAGTEDFKALSRMIR